MKKRKSGYFDFRYMNGAPPEITELALQEKLTHQQVKKLRNMTKIVHVMTQANIESLASYVEKHGGKMKRDFQTAKAILALYKQAGIELKDAYLHWGHNHYEQMKRHHSMNYMPKNPRQDNKSYINYGSGGGNGASIRRPKKVRKTAWKRFYKLFPRLKPVEENES